MSQTHAPLRVPRSSSPRRMASSRVRMAPTEPSGSLKDYSVLLGLATVGSVLLLHSIGARLSNEWHALVGPLSATPH